MNERSNEHYDYVYSVPGLEWRVRAFHFTDVEKAASEWERIEGESLGKRAEFSIWRTMLPDEDGQYIVLCGKAEKLPEVHGGVLTQLDEHSAMQFVMRRARVGHDTFTENPGVEHMDQQMRYGMDNPVVIDQKGGVRPYRPR